MSKPVAGTKETALRAMRDGTAAKMDAEVLKRITEATKGKKKGGKGTKKKPKPKGY